MRGELSPLVRSAVRAHFFSSQGPRTFLSTGWITAPAGIDFSEGYDGRDGRQPRGEARDSCSCTPSQGGPSPRMETKPIMRRVFVVSLLSLAAAGCAQSRSTLAKQDPSAAEPVSIKPVPSLTETVNRGMGNQAVVRSALKDPDDPRWSGRAPAASTASRAGTVMASPGQPQPNAAQTAGGAPAAGPQNGQVAQGQLATYGPGGAQTAATPVTAASAAVSSAPIVQDPGVGSAGPSQPGDLLRPVSTAAPGPVARGDMPETSMGLPTTGPIPVPPEQPSSGAASLPASGPANAAAITPASVTPATPAAVAPGQATRPARDPLLGPDPEVMPPIPDASEIRPRPAVKSNQPAVVQPGAAAAAVSKPQGPDTASSAAEVNSAALPTLPELPEPPPAASESIVTPGDGHAAVPPAALAPAAVAPAGNALSSSAGRPAGEAPALVAPAGSTPAAAPVPIELEPAPAQAPAAGASSGPGAESKGPGDSAALTEPARAGSVAALPPLEPAPPSESAGKTVTAQATAPPAGSPRRDEKLVQTSGEQTQPARTPSATPKNPAAERRRLAIEPGRPVAKVGDEVITFHDWTVAAKERLQQFPDLKAAYRNPDKAARAEAQKYIVMLGNSTLDMLIDRSLLVQDAKHHINKQKDGAKMLQNIYNEADERFREMEILPCSVNIISILSTRSPRNSPRKVDRWPRCEITSGRSFWRKATCTTGCETRSRSSCLTC